MASYPPPYNVDPRAQQRFVREQARMQKAAFRAQRNLNRQQARAMRRRSVLGPLLILAIGVVALLVRLGTISFAAFIDLFGRWWPVLLVASGVVLVLEWVFDQRVRPNAPALARRGIGGGAVALLLLLSLAGATLHGMHDAREIFVRGFSINPDNLGEFLGEKHQLQQELDEAFPPGTILSVENPRGDVSITGQSSDDHIHITVNKQVFSRSDADAEAKGRQLSPQIEQSGGTMHLIVPALDGATSDLSITLPESAQVNVDAMRGDVRIGTLHAPVNITANRGEVELNSIVGPVSAHLNHSDSSFAAHGITGDLVLKGHAQDLNLSDISGQVNLEGDFYGDTHIEHVGGGVAFETSRTHFTLGRLDGEIDISPDSELTANHATGPLVLRTRSRNISIEQLSGGAEISNSNGTVDLGMSAPLSNISISNKNGAVNLTVPANIGLLVHAETRGGEITNDMNLEPTTSGDQVTLNGTVRDGATRINLLTDHADIGLHQGAAILAPQPAAPKPARRQKAETSTF